MTDWQQWEGSPHPPANNVPPAAWYPDPGNPTRVRYWDGAAWTEHSQPAHPPMSVAPVKGSLRTQAQVLKALFWTLMAISVGTLLSNFATRRLLVRLVEDPESVSESELTASDVTQGLLAIVGLLAFLATVVMFLVWFHRAYRDPALNRAQLRFSPGWSIGSWFVPFLNLVRPKQIMDDIWRASGPTRPAESPEGRPRVPGLLHAWWALFLLSNFVAQASLRTVGLNPDTPAELLTANTWDIASNLFEIPSIILAILVVTRVTQRILARGGQVPDQHGGS